MTGTDVVTSSTVICQGGLDTTENHLYLDQSYPGGASELINYEVSLNGGYRRIDGFQPFSEDYNLVDSVNAEGPVLGVFIYKDISTTETVMAARKQVGSNTYKIYHLTGSGWVAYAPGFTLSSVGVIKIRKAKIIIGNKSYIIFTDGVNFPYIFDGTSWYQLKSANAGTSISPGGNQLLDDPKYVTVFKGHIFFSGSKTYPGVICHSAPQDVFNYTAASGGGQLVAGWEIVYAKPFREALYVFGTQAIKNITVSSTNFVINDTATNIGCIAPDSIQEINGDIIFLAQDGIRTVSGTDKIGDINLAVISKKIQGYVNYVQNSFDLRYLNSIVIKKKSQFRYFISEPSATADSFGIIGGLREFNGNIQWEFGKLAGIRTSCVENEYLSNVEVTLHGDYNGKVYIQETGNEFEDSVITSVYITPYITFGDPIARKQQRKLHVYLKPEGPITMSIKPKLDWADPASSQPNTTGGSLTPTGAVYDSGFTYDSGAVYGGDESYPVIDLDMEASFKSIKYSFTTSSNTASHSIQGFIIEITPQGTR